MPRKFQLTRKAAPESGPVAPTSVDVELCNLVHETPHEWRYVCSWVDMVTFWLGCGWTWMQIRVMHMECRADTRSWHDGKQWVYKTGAQLEHHHEHYNNLARITDYLESTFTFEVW